MTSLELRDVIDLLTPRLRLRQHVYAAYENECITVSWFEETLRVNVGDVPPAGDAEEFSKNLLRAVETLAPCTHEEVRLYGRLVRVASGRRVFVKRAFGWHEAPVSFALGNSGDESLRVEDFTLTQHDGLLVLTSLARLPHESLTYRTLVEGIFAAQHIDPTGLTVVLSRDPTDDVICGHPNLTRRLCEELPRTTHQLLISEL